MICPNDQTQMHQYKKLGGGESNEVEYITWEIKICPKCKRIVKEYYEARVLVEGDIEKILREKAEKAGEVYE